jgi:hypothetical protein
MSGGWFYVYAGNTDTETIGTPVVTSNITSSNSDSLVVTSNITSSNSDSLVVTSNITSGDSDSLVVTPAIRSIDHPNNTWGTMLLWDWDDVSPDYVSGTPPSSLGDVSTTYTMDGAFLKSHQTKNSGVFWILEIPDTVVPTGRLQVSLRGKMRPTFLSVEGATGERKPEFRVSQRKYDTDNSINGFHVQLNDYHFGVSINTDGIHPETQEQTIQTAASSFFDVSGDIGSIPLDSDNFIPFTYVMSYDPYASEDYTTLTFDHGNVDKDHVMMSERRYLRGNFVCTDPIFVEMNNNLYFDSIQITL